MADNEEGEQMNSRGNEWEVVTLTASAYAAAPGPDGVESINEHVDSNANESEGQTSQALFMSGHFVCPPLEDESLPIEPDNVEAQKDEKETEHGSTVALPEEGGFSEKKGEKEWNMDGLNVPEVLHSIYDETGKLLIHGSEFHEETALHGLDVAGTDPDVYNSDKFSSFCGATTMGGSIYDETEVMSNLESPTEVDLDEPCDQPHSDGKGGDPEVSPGAWWKRQLASLYAHAKETNPFWSIFIGAAVMGLVILGKRWQQERRQVLQQRWYVTINAEKSGRMLGPLSRFKDIFVGGSQRSAYIKHAIAADY